MITGSDLCRKFAVLLAVAVLAACGGSSSGSSPTPADPGPGEPPPEEPTPPAGPQARLDRVAGCDELNEALEQDASAKIAVQAEELRQYGFGVDEFVGTPVPGAPDPNAEDGDRGAEDFTDTNVQEEGVDEADIVETDGQRIYLLHGDELVILGAWPPETTAVESSTKVEGHPISLFVADGRAVVFSTVFDDGRFGLQDGGCGVIGAPFPVAEPALVGDIAPCRPSLVKTTVLDLTGAPTVVRELYAEGYYTAARRHGSAVRVVVQGGHGLPASVPDFYQRLYAGDFPQTEAEFLALVDAWERDALAAIANSTLEDWLPGQFEGGDVPRVVPPLCSAVHLPPPGETRHGMTRILAVDMAADETTPFVDTLIVGGASTVYASLESMVLAQPQWDADEDGDQTAVHVFGAGAASLETPYRGSGVVPGLPHGSFSFDMEGSVLRIATTQTSVDAEHRVSTANQIVTTELRDGALATLGSTGPLAPDERIFAVRYIGDRGYLVTFRQIDPLFVVDLSDPTSPTVLGELKIPGFSEYMHPLGENHLLTIGQEADEEGRVQGLALRIFDVSDDTNPLATHLYTFSGNGWSVANSDHLAFVFDPTRGTLTFPYVSYGEGFRSVLEVFSVDAEAGFEQLGEIDHSDLTADRCGDLESWRCAYDPEIRRGLLLEDFVYSISEAGVRVHGSDDLVAPLVTVGLPEIGRLPDFGPFLE